MKIALGTIEISDAELRAINEESGREGLATREQARSFIIDNGRLSLQWAISSEPDRSE